MMGPRQEAQASLFYEFSLEDHVPQDHLLRSIDQFADLHVGRDTEVRSQIDEVKLPYFPECAKLA